MSPITQKLALALCLAALLLPPSSGQTFTPNNCRMGEASNISQEIRFSVGGTYNACLHARPINTITYWLFTPMATSTALAYRVDSTLFSNTCIVMATGQVLVKVPQEPGFNIYTIMYEAEGGVTGEIVIHSGSTGAYTIIESGTVVPGVVAWRAYSDSQNVLAQYELCQKDRDGTLRTYEAGQIRIELAVADICDNQNNGDFTPISFRVRSSQGNTTGNLTLVVARGSCASALAPDLTTPLSYVFPDPTTPTSVTPSPTPSPTIQTTTPFVPNRAAAIAGGVVGGIVLIAIVVIVVSICVIVARRNRTKYRHRASVGILPPPGIPMGEVKNTTTPPGEEPREGSAKAPELNGTARDRSPILLHAPSSSTQENGRRSEIVVFYPIGSIAGSHTRLHGLNGYDTASMAALAVELKDMHELPLRNLFPLDEERNDNTILCSISQVVNSSDVKRIYVVWSGNLKDEANKEVNTIMTELNSRSIDVSKCFPVQLGGNGNRSNGCAVLVQGRLDVIHIQQTEEFDPKNCAQEIFKRAAQRTTHNGHIPRPQNAPPAISLSQAGRYVQRLDGGSGSSGETERQTVTMTIGETDHPDTPEQPNSPPPPPSSSSSLPTEPQPITESQLQTTEVTQELSPLPPSYTETASGGPPRYKDIQRVQGDQRPHSVPGTPKSTPLSSKSDTALVLERIDKLDHSLKALGAAVVDTKSAVIAAVDDTKAAVVDTKAAVVDTKAAVVDTKAAVDDTKSAVDDTKTEVKKVGRKVDATHDEVIDTNTETQERIAELNNKDKEKTVITDDQP